MFSYRHGFHAGNHADVLKHMVLVDLIDHLGQKDKPFWVIDTHAGGGVYNLRSGFAAKSGEAKGGIAQVWSLKDSPDLPDALRCLVAQIAACNEGDKLRLYPGSPQLAAQMLRPGDHLRLYELHPTESRALMQHFADVRRGVSIQAADGFASLKACLPPPPKRGLIHIDPPYELKEDYRRVLLSLQEALKRFPTGVYAIWYPMVARRESDLLPGQLKKVAGTLPWLHVNLRVKATSRDGLGLNGSGMFIINPPWTLYDRMAQAMPWLAEHLGLDDHAGYVLETNQV